VSQGPFQRVLRALHEHGVRYAVAGGVAAVLHGVARFTADLDVILDLEPGNVQRVIEAMRSLGMVARPPVDPEGLAVAETRESWVRDKGLVAFTFAHPSDPLVAVDILLGVPLRYDEAAPGIHTFEVDGLPVPTLGRTDLIRLKRLAGRPRDLEDVRALEEGGDGRPGG
jgi:hypothetical protein